MKSEEPGREGVYKTSWLCNVCNRLIYADFIDDANEVDLHVPMTCKAAERCTQLAAMMAFAPVENSKKHPI